jgi:hypothetical protein
VEISQSSADVLSSIGLGPALTLVLLEIYLAFCACVEACIAFLSARTGTPALLNDILSVGRAIAAFR